MYTVTNPGVTAAATVLPADATVQGEMKANAGAATSTFTCPISSGAYQVLIAIDVAQNNGLKIRPYVGGTTPGNISAPAVGTWTDGMAITHSRADNIVMLADADKPITGLSVYCTSAANVIVTWFV